MPFIRDKIITLNTIGANMIFRLKEELPLIARVCGKSIALVCVGTVFLLA